MSFSRLNEVFGLVITSIYWIKIGAVRCKVSDQSSCTLYNFLHFSSMMNSNWLFYFTSTQLKDASHCWNFSQATFVGKKNGTIL